LKPEIRQAGLNLKSQISKSKISFTAAGPRNAASMRDSENR
jgi:hypothetical protein